MTDKKIPLTIDGIYESIYAGFGLRFGSLLLDLLIISPYSFLMLYLNGLSKNAYYFTFIPNLIFSIWYSIYLVKRYGGTPGKLIVGIKILKLDGSNVTWKEAILRQIVTIVLTIYGSAAVIYALSIADTEFYEGLGWMRKYEYLADLAPLPMGIYTWTTTIWNYSELFVLLFNKRKRALHDFIAGTVIVKIKYINKIKEVINAHSTQTGYTNA